MGGQEDTKPELSDKDIIDKLKRILQCVELEGDVCKKDDEGDEWFKARKEKLRVPTDLREEEMKMLIAEKMKQTEQQDASKSPETVLNTVYPNEREEVKEETVERDCKKFPQIPQLGDAKNETPSQAELKYLDMGLLHGPNAGPFLLDMTMGEISVGCQCIKRNGLQADCKRKLCRGRKACLQLPLPGCIPSGHGRLKPKEAKIYIGEVSSCPKEDSIPLEKTVKVQKKRIPMQKDYIDNPPYQISGPCEIHKRGRYYIRPLRRSKNTQTEPLQGPAEKAEKQYPKCPPVSHIA